MIQTMFTKGESIRGKRRMGDKVFAFCVVVAVVAMFGNANALHIFDVVWATALTFTGAMYGLDMYGKIRENASS